jgi:hypothetical protein
MCAAIAFSGHCGARAHGQNRSRSGDQKLVHGYLLVALSPAAKGQHWEKD